MAEIDLVSALHKRTKRDYVGRVTGGKMEGSFRTDAGTEGRWTATKK